jgi:hypothetical protein
MKRMLSVVVLAVAMLAVLAVPALAATPANDGVGQAYGGHISAEAAAGMLGQDMNPGHHRGISGWPMPPMP